jgi:hypothetical protein
VISITKHQYKDARLTLISQATTTRWAEIRCPLDRTNRQFPQQHHTGRSLRHDGPRRYVDIPQQWLDERYDPDLFGVGPDAHGVPKQSYPSFEVPEEFAKQMKPVETEGLGGSCSLFVDLGGELVARPFDRELRRGLVDSLGFSGSYQSPSGTVCSTRPRGGRPRMGADDQSQASNREGL